MPEKAAFAPCAPGIAIVTSPTGAVLHDIRTVSARRNPAIPLTLLPVRVQGDGAAEEVAAAIRQAEDCRALM